MTTRVMSWLDLVIRSNPDHVRESRFCVEYEFTAPNSRNLDERTHEGGKRVFRGNYDERGPYRPTSADADALTLNGEPLALDGLELTFNGD